MYKGKRRWTKSKALLVSLVLIISVTVGGTLAYLVVGDGPIENTFTPSVVSTYVQESVNSGEKTGVKIQNTGDTTAYIRAAVVVTWQDEAGNVYGQKPKEGPDYTIAWGSDGWEKNDDGFYYYLSTVTAGDSTKVLIDKCVPGTGTAPDGYSLAVEIICSGIQSEGQDRKGNKPIELAWNVDIDDGELKDATIVP